MRARSRNAIAGVIVTVLAAIPLIACTDGTTPDCSGPEAGCAPDLSGSLESGAEAGDANTGYGDSATPTDSGKPPPPTDAGDASLDAADAHG